MGNGDSLLWSNRYQENFGANNHGGWKQEYAAQYLLKEGKVCVGEKPADLSVTCNVFMGVSSLLQADDPDRWCGRVTISYACNYLTGQWEPASSNFFQACVKNRLSDELRGEPCDEGTGFKWGWFEKGTLCEADGVTGSCVDRMKAGTTWDTSNCDGSKRYVWEVVSPADDFFAENVLNFGHFSCDGWTYEGIRPRDWVPNWWVNLPSLHKYSVYFKYIQNPLICSYQGKPSPEPTCSSSADEGKTMVEYNLSNHLVNPDSPFKDTLESIFPDGISIYRRCYSKTYKCVAK